MELNRLSVTGLAGIYEKAGWKPLMKKRET
jgi:hypothetical protein